MSKFNIYIDGSSQGNPGRAGAAALIYDADGQLLQQAARYLGQATNNVAEYNALLLALEEAAKLDGRQLQIFSDSELLVKQYNGEYKIKNKTLLGLHIKVRQWVAKFDQVLISHIPREENREADALANKAAKNNTTLHSIN
jgi:ribonuclease HI